MPEIYIHVAVTVPEEKMPSDRQIETLSRNTNDYVHTVLLDDLNLEELEVPTNRDPHFHGHEHKSPEGAYCEPCLRQAQDGRV